MNLGTGNRNQTIMAGVLGVLAVGACIFIYEELFATGPTVSTTPAPVVMVVPGAIGAPAARTVGKSSAALDPTLHMDAMLVSESVGYSGGGRNIFSANSVPLVVIPKPIAPARIQASLPVGPPPPPPGPPPPPPIDLKFFGVETSANGTPQAFLLHDDNVYMASAGDIVMRRYRVISIEAKSIQMEDMQNNNKQTLPLLIN